MIPDSYYGYAQGRESGGNPLATNPRSSSRGLYGFIDGTWDSLRKKYPEAGLTADGRGNADQEARAMKLFTRENAGVLQANGHEPSQNNLYLAHRFGSGGALKALSSPSDAYVSDIFPEVMSANPDLKGKRIADITGNKPMADPMQAAMQPPSSSVIVPSVQPRRRASAGPDLGMLSSRIVADGPGALFTAAPGHEQSPVEGVADAAERAGIYLSSIGNPEALKGLAALNANKDKYSTQFDKDNGLLLRTNTKTGATDVSPVPGWQEKVDPTVLKGLSEDWSTKYAPLQYAAERSAYFKKAIDEGRLNLDAMTRAKAAIESGTGTSSPETQLYNEYQQFRQQLANDSLRLNKGVQTEGDALRAMMEQGGGLSGWDANSMSKALHNFTVKAGKVSQDSARAQLDSYGGAYQNGAAFAPYRQKLNEWQGWHDDYNKTYEKGSQQPQRPPLSSFQK